MNFLRSRLTRGTAAVMAIFGAANILYSLGMYGTEPHGPPVAANAVLVLLGSILLFLGRARDARDGGVTNEDASTAQPPTVYRRVLVVGDDAAQSPLRDQLRDALMQQIATSPRYPLSADVVITAMSGPSLPEATRSAAEGFVWSLQERYARRGGAWQVDFHHPLGHDFMVVNLE